jgi:5S rRNA maturation endonuclease (ribonuclease M5)
LPEPAAYATRLADYSRDPNGYPKPTPGMPPIPVRQRKPMKRFVREYIDERRQAVAQDRTLLTRDIKNLNRVFYVLAPLMQDYGWEKDGWDKRRKYVLEYIKDICDELGIRRADIGIITDNVGYLYYRGRQHTVGIDHLKSLMSKGTDILIVEKQDVALSLNPLAKPYGIALLSTRGFLTENASDLAKLADDHGANVAILTDFDISGVVIADQVPEVPRIGIDEETLDDLHILKNITKIEEDYTPNPSHLKYVQDNPGNFEGLDLDYLETKRIHLDIVMEEVGNEKFWLWILDKLEETFPARNYNRVINIPGVYGFKPNELDDLESIITKAIKDVINPLGEQLEAELEEYKGFIEDVDDYENEIYDQFQEAVDENLGMDSFLEDLRKIAEKWDNGGYL